MAGFVRCIIRRPFRSPRPGISAASLLSSRRRGTRVRLLLAGLIFLVSAAAGTAGSPETFPQPVGAVNDFAGVASPEMRAKMEDLSREVLQKTGVAVVVAVLETIGGVDVNDYANRLYAAWGIGKKGEDRGVLILLAVRERRIRIETGYGVEGILPDGLAGEILDRYAIPHLKKNDFSSGLYSALAAVSAVVAKDAGVELTGLPRREARGAGKRAREGNWLTPVLLILAAAAILGTRRGREDVLPLLLLLLASGGRGRGGGGFGGFGGGGFGGFGGGSSGGGGASRGF